MAHLSRIPGWPSPLAVHPRWVAMTSAVGGKTLGVPCILMSVVSTRHPDKYILGYFLLL